MHNKVRARVSCAKEQLIGWREKLSWLQDKLSRGKTVSDFWEMLTVFSPLQLSQYWDKLSRCWPQLSHWQEQLSRWHPMLWRRSGSRVERPHAPCLPASHLFIGISGMSVKGDGIFLMSWSLTVTARQRGGAFRWLVSRWWADTVQRSLGGDSGWCCGRHCRAAEYRPSCPLVIVNV